MHVVRVLRGMIEEHPILVAYKDRLAFESAIFSGRLVAVDTPTSVEHGTALSLKVQVTNIGDQPWSATPTQMNYVRLGVQLLDSELKLIDKDYHRQSLLCALVPGESCTVHISCKAPETTGKYGIKMDLIRESVAWFEATGSTPAIRVFDVRP